VRFVALPGVPTLSSRTADYNPHNGGARIYSTAMYCTSGLPWVNTQGFAVMTGAGHCDLPYAGASWSTGAGPFGTDVFDGLQNANPNMIDRLAMIPPSGDIVEPYFYVGPANGNGLVTPKYWYSTDESGVVGIRTSGAVSGGAPDLAR
jgi:hypothetical protein